MSYLNLYNFAFANAWTRLVALTGAGFIAYAALSTDGLAESKPPVAAGQPSEQVKTVLRSYKEAIERLDAAGTEALFAPDAQVFESGGSEGTYQQYLARHLGPELVEFASFKFNDYTVVVRLEGSLALATETYNYRIVLKKGGDLIERKGVATSVLKQDGGRWQIIQIHSSTRKPKAITPTSP